MAYSKTVLGFLILNTTQKVFRLLCPCLNLHPWVMSVSPPFPLIHGRILRQTPNHLILLKSSDEVTVGIRDQKSPSSHLSSSNRCNMSLPSLTGHQKQTSPRAASLRAEVCINKTLAEIAPLLALAHFFSRSLMLKMC